MGANGHGTHRMHTMLNIPKHLSSKKVLQSCPTSLSFLLLLHPWCDLHHWWCYTVGLHNRLFHEVCFLLGYTLYIEWLSAPLNVYSCLTHLRLWKKYSESQQLFFITSTYLRFHNMFFQALTAVAPQFQLPVAFLKVNSALLNEVVISSVA